MKKKQNPKSTQLNTRGLITTNKAYNSKLQTNKASCLHHTKGFPTVRKRPVTQRHLSIFIEDLFGIYRYLSRIYRGFIEDLSRICRGFVEDLPRICRGFVEDLSKNSVFFLGPQGNNNNTPPYPPSYHLARRFLSQETWWHQYQVGHGDCSRNHRPCHPLENKKSAAVC